MGLITPIVRGVTGKGVRAISDEIKILGKKARDGKSESPLPLQLIYISSVLTYLCLD